MLQNEEKNMLERIVRWICSMIAREPVVEKV